MPASATSSILDEGRWIAIDVETTGWSPSEGHVLIELACVMIERGAIVDTWASLVNPGRRVPAAAREVHGIDAAMLEGAPDPAAVAPEFRARCSDLPLVMHHAAFDLGFLKPMLREAGVPPLYNPVVDTLGLARGLFGSGANALGQLRASLGLDHEPEHRAAGDARTTARVLLALVPRWERERGVRSVAELAAASQDVMRVAGRRGPGAEPGGEFASAGRTPAF